MTDAPDLSRLAALSIPLATQAMEARSADALPGDDGWQFEPKWDGFRCLAFRAGDTVELRAKSGKSLTRYFPEVAERLRRLKASQFAIDGELMIETEGTFSFEALQMRLHPAQSRVVRLAAETPAILVAFDALAYADGSSLLDAPLSVRRERLDALASGAPRAVQPTPFTRSRETAQGWLDNLEASFDGVVCKRLDGPYAPGERTMLKVKRLRTADCVVGGFRYLADRPLVGSLLLGLFDEAGKLDHVGYTASIVEREREAVTRRLEALRGGPGFTGDAPGGPSRWASERSAEWVPLRWELVVEVRFDHVSGGRIRHGATLIRWRPDKAPENCRREQIGG